MDDVTITLRSLNVGFAETRTRDIAGRGYDETRLATFEAREVRLIWRLIERAKRRLEAKRKAERIEALEAELAALRGVEWTIKKPELTLREYVQDAVEVMGDE
jgi:hypothetical protein